jgi:hypothetical protein
MLLEGGASMIPAGRQGLNDAIILCFLSQIVNGFRMSVRSVSGLYAGQLRMAEIPSYFRVGSKGACFMLEGKHQINGLAHFFRMAVFYEKLSLEIHIHKPHLFIQNRNVPANMQGRKKYVLPLCFVYSSQNIPY